MLVVHLLIQLIGIMFDGCISLPSDSSMSDEDFIPTHEAASKSNEVPPSQNTIDQDPVAQNLVAQDTIMSPGGTLISTPTKPDPDGLFLRRRSFALPSLDICAASHPHLPSTAPDTFQVR